MTRYERRAASTPDSVGYAFIGFIVGFLAGTVVTIYVMSTIMAAKPKREVTEVRPVVVTVYPQRPQDTTKAVDELLKRRPMLPTFSGAQ